MKLRSSLATPSISFFFKIAVFLVLAVFVNLAFFTSFIDFHVHHENTFLIHQQNEINHCHEQANGAKKRGYCGDLETLLEHVMEDVKGSAASSSFLKKLFICYFIVSNSEVDNDTFITTYAIPVNPTLPYIAYLSLLTHSPPNFS